MAEHQFFSTQSNSAAFEQEALERFREVLLILPEACRLHREAWDQSTVLCLDFQDCPEELADVKNQALMILLGADYLGLAQAISFRIGNKIKGWSNFATTDL